jgi:hypothetical protein
VEVRAVGLPLKPVITVTGSASFCAGDSVVLTAPQSSAYTWSTGASSQSIVVKQQGTYRVRIKNDQGCESAMSDPVNTLIHQLPAAPIIEQVNLDTLTASVVGATYEWKKDGVPLTANTRKIKVNENGHYAVRVKDANGCFSAFSQDFRYIVADKNTLNQISLYPNPAPGEITLLIENSASPNCV